MTARTALYDRHAEFGARFIEFAGWLMPLSYRSVLEEHHAVRRSAGVFDVSHMTIIDVGGDRAVDFLARLLANDVRKLRPGKALYSCMLGENGGVLDDLVVYRLAGTAFRLIANAATRAGNLAWLERHAVDGMSFAVRADLALVAVQGPDAAAMLAGATSAALGLGELAPFGCVTAHDTVYARTGYTGEDGYEIMLPAERASRLWQDLIERGATPCGLGARDTLRLEAGLNLYGADMDEQVLPHDCGLGWTVALDDERPFIGRPAVEAHLAGGVSVRRVGLVLAGRAVARAHHEVRTSRGDGLVTSGNYSPTMGRPIALARVPAGAGRDCRVRIRGREHDARIVTPPFVRHGRILVEQ